MSDLDDDELRATRKLNGVEWKEDKQIQVGDYVRTKDGVIAKIIQEIEEDYEERGNILYELDKETYDDTDGFEVYSCYALPDQFKKYNHNLIDLIECGDYVNGEQVYKGYTANGEEKLLVNFDHVHGMALEVINIKTICTHEQFNSVMYKVKE